MHHSGVRFSMHQPVPSIIISAQSLEDSAVAAIRSLPPDHVASVMDRYASDDDFFTMVNAAVLYLATRVSMARTVICTNEEFKNFIQCNPPVFGNDFDARLIMNAILNDEIRDQDEFSHLQQNQNTYTTRLHILKSMFV